MIGTTISHYEITAGLGRGGMGVVYRARDTRLNRDVAIKVLAGHLKGDEKAQARFEQEARAASALNHDHIGAVHDVGVTEDGQMYSVIAYYEGSALDDLIDEGPLPESDAIRYASQASSALAAAHRAGIIHRDIKPANMMIPDGGSLKILDFGLAKLAGAVDLTVTGSTLGTMAYMSPEQTRGETATSASDVWSLGVVMYEMLSGHRPFEGSYPSAVVYSILNVEAPRLEGVSENIADLVQSCLSKEASERATAEDLATRLRSSAGTVAASGSADASARSTGPKRLLVPRFPCALSL